MILALHHLVCSCPHPFLGRKEGGGQRVLKARGRFSPGAPPHPLPIQFTELGALALVFPIASPRLQPLHTFSPTSQGQRQIKPSFLPRVNHSDQSEGRGEEKPGEEECAVTPGEQMCLASRAQSWPNPESQCSFVRSRNYIFSPVQSSLYKKKKIKEIKIAALQDQSAAF